MSRFRDGFPLIHTGSCLPTFYMTSFLRAAVQPSCKTLLSLDGKGIFISKYPEVATIACYPFIIDVKPEKSPALPPHTGFLPEIQICSYFLKNRCFPNKEPTNYDCSQFHRLCVCASGSLMTVT